jgi:hypothetical protein
MGACAIQRVTRTCGAHSRSQREKAPEGAEVAFIARGILAQNFIRVRLARTSAKPVEGWRKTRRDDAELPIFRRLAQSR